MSVTGLGVAGLGGLGEALVMAAPSIEELQVVAVQDVRVERAREVGAAYSVAWCGERFEDLLRADGVGAIVICTPNAMHAEQAQAAMRAGKDVLVQKPLAMAYADARATIDLAAQLDRLLFVDYSYRFLETVRDLRRALVHIGEVQSGRATFHNVYGPGADKAWFFDPKLSGGGALIDLGVHLLDLGLWLLPPAAARLEAASFVWPDERSAVEYGAHVLITLGSVPFEVDVSWNAPRATTDISFEIQGDDGLVRWENVDGSFFRFRTLLNGALLVERETTLRADTLRAFADALASRRAPAIDARVYALLDQAYQHAGRAGHSPGVPGEGVPS